jgi:hypothetical protein
MREVAAALSGPSHLMLPAYACLIRFALLFIDNILYAD